MKKKMPLFTLPPTTNRGVKYVETTSTRFNHRDCIIKSAGFDWLTLTSENPESKLAMWRYFSSVAADDLQHGYAIVPGGAYGFYGKRARHALFAEKENRAMLQVSGRRAQQSYMLALPGDNATRIDVQITFTCPGEEPHEWLERCAYAVMAKPNGVGKPRQVVTIAKNGQTETVYIGSRKSDFFFRCYDKFAESGEEEYRGTVRVELEIKGKASKALWAHMAETGKGVLYLLSLLLQRAEGVGIPVEGIDLARQDIVLPKKQTTKESVTLAWFASQVAPAVARISGTSGWISAFAPLFHLSLTEYDRRTIMRLLSVAWGN